MKFSLRNNDIKQSISDRLIQSPQQHLFQKNNDNEDVSRGKLSLTNTGVVVSTGIQTLPELISDDERRIYSTLKNIATEEVCHMLDQKQLASLLELSQSTISRRINLLRIQRLITLISNKSNLTNINGRQSYVINPSPTSLHDTLQIDSNYLVFLTESVVVKNARIKKVSSEELIKCISSLCTTELREKVNESPQFTAELREINKYLPHFSDEVIDILKNSPLFTRYSAQFSAIHSLFTRYSPQFTAELRDTYNTACARTPTHSINSVGVNSTTTSSSRHVDNSKDETTDSEGNSLAKPRGGSSDDFLFFENDVYIREVLFDLQTLLGKKSVHAIKNLLKQKNYETKSKKPYRWVCDKDSAFELLVAVLHDKPNYPIGYLQKLIYEDSNGLFALKPKQQSLLTEIRRRIDPDYSPVEQLNKPSKKLTKLGELQNFLFAEEPQNYKPVQLFEGDHVIALEEIPFFKAAKGDSTTVEVFDYATDINNLGESMYARFQPTTTIYYDAICKCLELGLIKIEPRGNDFD